MATTAQRINVAVGLDQNIILRGIIASQQQQLNELAQRISLLEAQP